MDKVGDLFKISLKLREDEVLKCKCQHNHELCPSEQNLAALENARKHLVELHLKEDIFWRQRMTWLKEGDNNTKFFHAVVQYNRKRSRYQRCIPEVLTPSVHRFYFVWRCHNILSRKEAQTSTKGRRPTPPSWMGLHNQPLISASSPSCCKFYSSFGTSVTSLCYFLSTVRVRSDQAEYSFDWCLGLLDKADLMISPSYWVDDQPGSRAFLAYLSLLAHYSLFFFDAVVCCYRLLCLMRALLSSKAHYYLHISPSPSTMALIGIVSF